MKSNDRWFDEGLKLPLEKLRNDTLFITFVSAYDGPISGSIRDFIANKITVDEFDFKSRYIPRPRKIFSSRNIDTNQLLEEGKNELVLDWLRRAGIDYANIKLEDSKEASRSIVIVQKQV